MRIIIRTPIYPTEDPTIISDALGNIFPDAEFDTVQEGNISWLHYESDNRLTLQTFRNMIHESRIIDAARRLLETHWTGTKCSIQLDKQAALQSKLRLIDQDDDPPLGDIEVILSLSDTSYLEDFLLWFTPPTKDGRIIKN